MARPHGRGRLLARPWKRAHLTARRPEFSGALAMSRRPCSLFPLPASWSEFPHRVRLTPVHPCAPRFLAPSASPCFPAQPRRVSPPWPPCRAPPTSLPGVPGARTQPARRAPWWPCSHLLGVPWRSPMARSPLPGASPSQATSSPWCFPVVLCSDSCWPRAPCFSLAGAPCVLGFKFLCACSTAPIASSSLPRLSGVWPTPIRVRSYRHRRVVAGDSFACASSSRVESLSSSPRRPTSYLLCSPALATRWCSNSSAVVVLSASARDRGRVRRVRQRSVADSTIVAVVRFAVCSLSVVGCTSALVLAAGSR
jgi:hypothetical protein